MFVCPTQHSAVSGPCDSCCTLGTHARCTKHPTMYIDIETPLSFRAVCKQRHGSRLGRSTGTGSCDQPPMARRRSPPPSGLLHVSVVALHTHTHRVEGMRGKLCQAQAGWKHPVFCSGPSGLAPQICHPCGRSASSGAGLSWEMEKRKCDLHFEKA